MKQSYDILIVGAGMVGLTAAGLLSKNEQLSITIVDAGKRPVFNAKDEESN